MSYDSIEVYESIYQIMIEVLRRDKWSIILPRYMIEKLRHQCEAALMSGVLVTKENMFPVCITQLRFERYPSVQQMFLSENIDES